MSQATPVNVVRETLKELGYWNTGTSRSQTSGRDKHIITVHGSCNLLTRNRPAGEGVMWVPLEIKERLKELGLPVVGVQMLDSNLKVYLRS